MKRWRWRFRTWRLRRHLPRNFDQLSGIDKLRAVNNAVAIRDGLDHNLLRAIPK